MAMDLPMRYYSVGEYGTLTERPHYHSIIFNLSEELVKRMDRVWPYGHIHAGTVSDASIHYVTKYVINRTHDYSGRESPFALMSRRPGLGASYVQSHSKWHKIDMRNYTQANGIKRRIPRYLKDKIFDQFDRAYLTSQATSDSVAKYWDEIERISPYHNDPFMYYDERISFAHNEVIQKVNSQNTF